VALRAGLLFLTLGTTGCADLFLVQHSIPRDEIGERLGPAPTGAQQEQLTRDLMTEYAIDPDSVKIRSISHPLPGWISGGLWGWIRGKEGWLWSAQVNAKNRFGGYTGWKVYRFLFDARNNQAWFGQVYPMKITE